MCTRFQSLCPPPLHAVSFRGRIMLLLFFLHLSQHLHVYSQHRGHCRFFVCLSSFLAVHAPDRAAVVHLSLPHGEQMRVICRGRLASSISEFTRIIIYLRMHEWQRSS